MDDLQHEPANPQLENGHTRIANEILEALCRYRIPGEEMQCLLVVIRKTYGFGKKEDEISLSQFAAMTGLKRPNVSRALTSLLSKKILAVIKKDTTGISKYLLNKDYHAWSAVIKKDTTPRPAVIIFDKALLSKKIPTKETLTKERNICAPPKQKRSHRPPSGDQRTFLAWWSFAYKKTQEKAYMISGKDVKAAADLLNIHALKPLVIFGSYFLTCHNEWLGSKRDLPMFRSMINQMPGHKDPAHNAETYRAAGIIPPDGVKFEDWCFWEQDINQEVA